MFLIHFILALCISVLLTGFFTVIVRRTTTLPLFIFFLIVFLGTWVGGIWIMPLGPTIGGVFWLPFFFTGLILSLLLLAVLPPGPPRVVFRRRVQIDREEKTEEIIGIFFVVLMTALIVGIVGRYFL